MGGKETSVNDVNRRMFLQLVGAAAAIYAAKRLGIATTFAQAEGSSDRKQQKYAPENIDGVDVYGLKESMSTVRDVAELYQQIDDIFIKSNNIDTAISGPEDLLKLQKEHLNPNERYLEVVVKRSAYNSFEQKKEETGVNFPEWVKTHVDVLNRCLDEAQPQVRMKAILRRIVIVEDKCSEEFLDKKTQDAFDIQWDRQFWPPPVDTDASWAIADDYREKGGSYFYNIRNIDGKVVAEKYFSDGNERKEYEFQGKRDSLNGKDNISFDMGLVHEWSHRLLNLPDEYSQSVSDPSQRFTSFEFATGSFLEPVMSPYLSYVLQENIKLRARNFYDPATSRSRTVFSERPEKIRVATSFEDVDFRKTSVEVRAVRLLEDSYYGRKEVPEDFDQRSASGPLDLNNNLFDIKTNCWLVRAEGGEKNREVFLPAAAFNMSKIAGLSSSEYDIIFSGFDDLAKTRQEVKLVNKKDVVKLHYNQHDPVYAEMKIPGTDLHMMWFLR
ncbi:MAG: hypothetical protein WC629_02835 [Candidatus Paceibacterota bacterium]|jgi:hypothetical protein